MSDLQILVPTPVIVEVNGEKVEIRQLKFRQLGEATPHIKAISEKVAGIFKSMAPTKSKKVTMTNDAGESHEIEVPDTDGEQEDGLINMVEIAMAVLESHEDIAKIIALSTGKTAEWVGDLEVDDIVKLAVAIIQVNQRFFVQKLLPAIAGLGAVASR